VQLRDKTGMTIFFIEDPVSGKMLKYDPLTSKPRLLSAKQSRKIAGRCARARVCVCVWRTCSCAC
jgi:hypothetical protein